MDLYMTALKGVVEQSGFVALNLPTLIMLLVAFILLYLAIAKPHRRIPNSTSFSTAPQP